MKQPGIKLERNKVGGWDWYATATTQYGALGHTTGEASTFLGALWAAAWGYRGAKKL